MSGTLPISVVVPTRNAEAILEECLTSIVANDPDELIVVDGCSTDRTVEIARRFGANVATDGGQGLPYARLYGAKLASNYWVSFVDADVVLPEGSLASLFGELIDDGYVALQAGLHSVCTESDYWGEALAHHHRTGRSRHWFGLVATIFERNAILDIGFDDRFVSGEDIDLRWRLRQAGKKAGVSSQTTVLHRFPAGYDFACGQWDADGRGLARMARNHGPRGTLLLAMPAAAAVRGAAHSLATLQPRWIRYFAHYAVNNYRAIADELRATEPSVLPATSGAGADGSSVATG
jgi:glycosyltransferase involved in cell wall biosynthesis